MNRRRKLAYKLAVVGVGITVAIFAYLENTNYTLCPAKTLAGSLHKDL